MITLANRIIINKPVEEVFTFISEFENIPRWNYYVKEVSRIPVQKGSRTKYRQVRKSDFQEFEIIDFQFPVRIEIATTGDSNINFKRRFDFDTDPSDNCILKDLFEIESGYPQIMQTLFRRKMQQAVNENLFKLKELLEMGQTVLQDGRISMVTIQN